MDRPIRGIYRETISPADEQWYKVVTSSDRVGVIRLPQELCDAQTEERLWVWLDEKDPVCQLKAV